jgi:hypothetical protein
MFTIPLPIGFTSDIRRDTLALSFGMALWCMEPDSIIHPGTRIPISRGPGRGALASTTHTGAVVFTGVPGIHVRGTGIAGGLSTILLCGGAGWFTTVQLTGA